MEEPMQGKNILIVHESLQFELKDELINHVMILDDCLGDFF